MKDDNSSVWTTVEAVRSPSAGGTVAGTVVKISTTVDDVVVDTVILSMLCVDIICFAAVYPMSGGIAPTIAPIQVL